MRLGWVIAPAKAPRASNMEWYYAENNEQRGPVGEAEFNALVRSGRITATTSVWRNGWENWRPLGEAGVQAARATPAIATDDQGQAVAPCVECRRPFPTSEMLQFEGAWV